MRLGVCTTDFPRMPVKSLFEKIAGLGFSAVQLSFDSFSESGFQADGALELPAHISEETLDSVRQAVRLYHLPVVAINGTFNMAHPDAGIRAEGLRRLAVLSQAAVELSCESLSICTGTREASDLWRYHADNETQAAWTDMEETVCAACDIARARRVKLLLEVEASNVVNTPEKALALIQKAGPDALGIVLDCANLFHVGEASRERAVEVIGHAFDVLGNDIALAHGKDIAASDGIRFCPTGDGIVDFPYFFHRLRGIGYQGDMMLHGIYHEDAMKRAVQKIVPLVEMWNRDAEQTGGRVNE